jgi:hypothetical protein
VAAAAHGPVARPSSGSGPGDRNLATGRGSAARRISCRLAAGLGKLVRLVGRASLRWLHADDRGCLPRDGEAAGGSVAGRLSSRAPAGRKRTVGTVVRDGRLPAQGDTNSHVQRCGLAALRGGAGSGTGGGAGTAGRGCAAGRRSRTAIADFGGIRERARTWIHEELEYSRSALRGRENIPPAG